MERAYWSLRNKTEEVGRALAQRNNAWARMAAFELGIRLSHTITALQLQAGSSGHKEKPTTDDPSIEKGLAQLVQELDRLRTFLQENQEERATEVVQLLFELLDTLDHKGGR